MITVNFNIVTAEDNIALGNHMFQYAICRLIAEKNNYNFYIPYGHYLIKVFPNLNLGINDGKIINTYQEADTQKYNESIFDISDFTNLNGYYQTDKYFNKNEEKVKSWFSIEIDEKTNFILNKYPIDKYCYIHIRGGDYKIAGHSLLPKEYYQNAINKINESKNEKKSFLIITDDINLSKSYFPDIEAISNDVATDFKLLYFCKNIIMSNSSFSWWASWISDKEISIAPNNWLNYNRPELGFHPIDINSNKFTFI